MQLMNLGAWAIFRKRPKIAVVSITIFAAFFDTISDTIQGKKYPEIAPKCHLMGDRNRQKQA